MINKNISSKSRERQSGQNATVHADLICFKIRIRPCTGGKDFLPKLTSFISEYSFSESGLL